MPFERIENCRSSAASGAVPSEGVRVVSRKVAKRQGDGLTRYIKISIGPALANKLVLRGETARLAVAFGTDRDAGKIRLQVDTTSGDFTAKRGKRGGYSLTLNEKTANGLFSLEFPPFDLPELEAVCKQGEPPALVFEASAEMLKVED